MGEIGNVYKILAKKHINLSVNDEKYQTSPSIITKTGIGCIWFRTRNSVWQMTSKIQVFLDVTFIVGRIVPDIAEHRIIVISRSSNRRRFGILLLYFDCLILNTNAVWSIPNVGNPLAQRHSFTSLNMWTQHRC